MAIVEFFVDKILPWVYILFCVGLLIHIDFSEYSYYGYGRYYRNQHPGCITFSVIAFAIIYFLWWLITSYPLLTISIVIGIVIMCFGLYKLYNRIDYKGRIDKYERTVNEYIFCKTKHEEKEAEYLTFDRIPIPENCEIKYGFPAEKGSSDKWGEKFTVYLSDKGGKVHIVRGCSSVFKERHIYEVSQYKNFYLALCKKCGKNYVVPDMLWYENYLQYSKLLREMLELPGRVERLKWDGVECREKCNTPLMKFILLFDRNAKKRLNDIDETFKIDNE